MLACARHRIWIGSQCRPAGVAGLVFPDIPLALAARERKLYEVPSLFPAGNRLATVTDSRGIGKTCLALQLCLGPVTWIMLRRPVICSLDFSRLRLDQPD